MPVVFSQPRFNDAVTLRVRDPLHAPIDGELRSRVLTLLRSGERDIVLDLAGVSSIDAAGVGELARLYRLATAANGALHVVRPTRRVREVLDRVGVIEILTQHRYARGLELA